VTTDRKQLVGWLALLAATALGLYLCWLMLQPFLDVVLWSVVFVIVFHPVQKFLVARTGRPALSALISCLVVLMMVITPLAFVVVAVINEARELTDTLPQHVSNFLAATAPLRERLHPYVNLDEDQLKEWIKNALQGAPVVSFKVAQSVVGFGLQVLFVLFTMYYLFLDGDRLVAALRERLPLTAEQSEVIFRRTREVLSASVHGVLIVAVIQGMLCGVAFWVLGVPSPILWTLVLTVLATIPLAGSLLVWIPAALYLLATGHWVQALLLTVWCGLVVSSVDNFLRPKLVGGRARLHELFVFFSVLGGLQLFGPLGMVLGPVVLAITLALLDVLHPREAKPGEERNGADDAGPGSDPRTGLTIAPLGRDPPRPFPREREESA
jgi:predicted PurR-regulated permease PerM